MPFLSNYEEVAKELLSTDPGDRDWWEMPGGKRLLIELLNPNNIFTRSLR